MKLQPEGLATGIGSLPHTDSRAAVSVVEEYMPFLPHWPQLPRLTPKEFYIHQFLNFLQELGLLRKIKDTKACFASEDPGWAERLARFYEVYLQAAEGDERSLEYLAFPPEAAAGFEAFLKGLEERGPSRARFLKGQVVGLLTAGFQITDPGGRPAYYDPQLRDLLLKQLSLQAAWQVKTLGRFGLPVLVFMDDPVIDSCGRYDRIVVSKDEVMAELGEFAGFVRNRGGLAGVHSCADLDWSLLLEADIDIISFDAYQFAGSFVLFSGLIRQFLEKGGVIAWGLVPTDGKALASEEVPTLVERLRYIMQTLIKKGVDPYLLETQSLITPACGAGTLTEPEAVRIYRLTAELAKGWRELFQTL